MFALTRWAQQAAQSCWHRMEFSFRDVLQHRHEQNPPPAFWLCRPDLFAIGPISVAGSSGSPTFNFCIVEIRPYKIICSRTCNNESFCSIACLSSIDAPGTNRGMNGIFNVSIFQHNKCIIASQFHHRFFQMLTGKWSKMRTRHITSCEAQSEMRESAITSAACSFVRKWLLNKCLETVLKKARHLFLHIEVRSEHVLKQYHCLQTKQEWHNERLPERKIPWHNQEDQSKWFR